MGELTAVVEGALKSTTTGSPMSSFSSCFGIVEKNSGLVGACACAKAAKALAPTIMKEYCMVLGAIAICQVGVVMRWCDSA